ncbi:hypothetical protein J6590_069849 [Homalodisca vitripennis]|nr:hypothetical protein J6590_069849 [Homalodisca vitripennis]
MSRVIAVYSKILRHGGVIQRQDTSTPADLSCIPDKNYFYNQAKFKISLMVNMVRVRT